MEKFVGFWGAGNASGNAVKSNNIAELRGELRRTARANSIQGTARYVIFDRKQPDAPVEQQYFMRATWVNALTD